MALQHLRSSTANKRPLPGSMSDGQIAINTNTSSPGLFFKDSAGTLIKVGPVHVGSTAPNASPAGGGETGNTVGEQWLDTSGSTYVFKVWDGSAWRSESGTFVDVNGDVMTGALGIIAGTAGAPGLYISGDTNTGIYSPGTDQISVTTGGTERLRIDSTGQIEAVSLGTDAAPVFSFTGDPNTGIYSPGADQVAISTNGTGRLFVDSNGYIGIGTSSFTAGTAGRQVVEVNGSSSTLINLDAGGTRRAYIYSDSTDTVFYNTQAGPLTLGTNNQERLRITSAGLVGVGSSGPVNGNVAILNLRQTGGNLSSTTVTRANAQGVVIADAASSTNNYGNGIWFDSGSLLAGIASTRITTANWGTDLRFYTHPTATSNVDETYERLRIDSEGRVGIGTTAPQYLSHINATKNTTSLFITTNSVSTAQDYSQIGFGNNPSGSEIFAAIRHSYDNPGAGAAGALRFYTHTGSVLNERLAIDSSGRLLVGTSSARSNFFNNTIYAPKVQIEGAAASDRLLSVTSSEAGNGGFLILAAQRSGTVGGNTVLQSNDQVGVVSFQGSDGSEFVDAARIEAYVDATPGANDMPGRLVFSTTADGASSPTERMRIKQNGFIKISSTGGYYNEGASFHEFRSAADNNEALFVSHGGTSGSQYGITVYTTNDQNDTTRFFLSCSGGATLRAAIRSNGGLANYQANDVNLSDINTKKDISPAAGTWDCIKEWEIVNYRYKDQPDDADLNLGVIAQQVAESCPEIVTVFEEAKDDQPEKLGVREQQMYWMAIKALQEAQVRIEALEAEVAALKAQ